MVQKYRTPFTKTLFEKTIEDVVIPPDLTQYITMGSNVSRYKFQDGNFDHIFDDRVDEHTKRMVLYAQTLPLNEKDKSDVIRTLWIHDIPEIVDSQTSRSDMTSIDKIRHPHLALAVKNREQKIVSDIFSLEDKLLYEAFEPAKDMLYTGKIDREKTTPVAIIARVLDNFIDGTNSFHGFVVDYLKGPNYRDSLALPGCDSFEYCFHRGLDVYTHVSAISDPYFEEAQHIILDILQHDFFGFVEEIWSPLALARLPEYAQKEHEKYLEKRKYITFSK